MVVQRTFLAVKPDGVRRKLVGEIISRFEKKGCVMIAAKMVMPSKELLTEHYIEHEGKPFLPTLIEFMGTGPVFAMVWEGENIIAEARSIMGATKPWEAAVGTIRKDYCQTAEKNVIHGSDCAESAEREIALWFKKDEICAYEPCDLKWLYK